jgi:hypothetical protein
VPIDDIVRGLWREAVVEKDAKGQQRINRITYEGRKARARKNAR